MALKIHCSSCDAEFEVDVHIPPPDPERWIGDPDEAEDGVERYFCIFCSSAEEAT